MRDLIRSRFLADPLGRGGTEGTGIFARALADAGFAQIASWRDLAGIERVSGGRWLGRG